MKSKLHNSNNESTISMLSSILLLAYGFITWLTPNMDTFDSNGPKFWTFSILNLLVFTVLIWYVRKEKSFNFLFRFFDTKVGLAYGVLILFSLLSFVKAININESILHFSKVFTTFAAAWFISIIVSRDKKPILYVAIALSVLLILDSFQTFKGISDFINGDLKSIGLLKATYSNKNILSSAIFIKIPFALWLFYYQKSWIKYLGAFSLFLGVLAIFFMSSRAFYLGLIIISILLVIYSIIKYRQNHDKSIFMHLMTYVGIVIISFGIFSLVQSKMYPNNNTAFGSRISSIASTSNNSNKLRLTSWKTTTTEMIPNDPILGVGIGNWKLRYLEYENSWSPTYTYMYKNHNDFIEIAAESGIIAGVAFLLIFIFIFWYFVKALIKAPSSDREKYFFLPAFGMLAYFFDAFFNFPQDRPEIQSWFALYVGIAAGLMLYFNNGDSPLLKYKFKGKKYVNIIIGVLTLLLLVSSVYVLTLNKKSLVFQRDVKEEINRGKLKTPSEKFIHGFPSIPDITILEEPIAVQKARFLISEEKFDEARRILRADKSNPFDGRKEYFIAITFYKDNELDSALFYARKAHNIKPYFYNTNTIMASVYEKQGNIDSSIILWKNYLKGVKNKEQAWLVPATHLLRKNKLEEAKSIIDSASVHLPNSKKIKKLRAEIKQRSTAGPHMKLYRDANKLYSQKKYAEALAVYSEFLKIVPDFAKAYEFRAVCYFRLGKFKEAIEDINKEEEIVGSLPANILNIRGAGYLNIGDKARAKKDFKASMKQGDKDGKSNYEKFFKKEDKNISFKVPVKK